MQKCGKKFGIYNNPLIGKNKQFLQEIMDKISGIIRHKQRKNHVKNHISLM